MRRRPAQPCRHRAGTVRRQADTAAWQLAAAVRSSHDAIFGADLQGRLTTWNAGAERVRRDGSRFAVSISANPIRNDRGRLVGVTSIQRDISDRVRLETERGRLAALVAIDGAGCISEQEALGRRASELVAASTRSPIRDRAGTIAGPVGVRVTSRASAEPSGRCTRPRRGSRPRSPMRRSGWRWWRSPTAGSPTPTRRCAR